MMTPPGAWGKDILRMVLVVLLLFLAVFLVALLASCAVSDSDTPQPTAAIREFSPSVFYDEAHGIACYFAGTQMDCESFGVP